MTVFSLFPKPIRLLRACVLVVVGSIGIAVLSTYVIDALTRQERLPSCKWNSIPGADAVPYVARWCKLTKNTVVLRLYDVGASRLLVERSFSHLDRPNFYWDNNGIGYDSQDGGDDIALPPSLIEKLRASLP